MNILFINHSFVECGVYQLGKRVYNLLSRSKNLDIFYREIDNRDSYISTVSELQPEYIIYNWHWDRLPWLDEVDVKRNKYSKHYFIYHDGSMFRYYDKYLFFGDFDPARKAVPEGSRILLPRPLIDYTGTYPTNSVPTIGSFGFAFNHKRYHELVKLVNKSFTEAVINLHIPNPYFGDTEGNRLSDIIAYCRIHNTNPKIKLNISTNFMKDQELLTFLAGNDINVFYYGDLTNPGLSSAPDYALSVHRPIAITSNPMFRHVMSDDILLEKHSIQEILDKGTAPLQKYYEDWSTSNFVAEMERIWT